MLDYDTDRASLPTSSAPAAGGETATPPPAPEAPRYQVAPEFFPPHSEEIQLPEPFERCTVQCVVTQSDAEAEALWQQPFLAIVQAVVTGWNLTDTHGQPIPCTAETIAACLPPKARASIAWEWRERRNTPLQWTKLLSSARSSNGNTPTSTNGTTTGP